MWGVLWNVKNRVFGEVIQLMKYTKNSLGSKQVFSMIENMDVIARIRFGDESDIVGKEKDGLFKGSIGNIYQSYSTVIKFFLFIKEVYIKMDIRILRYFLTVAKEQNFTKAAEQLNITQPTLSRQLAALEDELGTALFIRGNRSITLTESGILLKRRDLEIIDLEEKMLDELKVKEELMEGTITIGCGEFSAVETLAEICKVYKQKYPMVQIALHTATADSVYEMMNQGLVDIGLFLEPVNTEGLDYIRIMESDHWIVGMKPDDPLADKEYITKEELLDKQLILPQRLSVQSELANWFGKDFNKLHVSFTSNLGTNAGVMAIHGLGYPISIEGAAKYWREELLVQRRLYPEITASTVIAWRRNIPYSLAINKFIEEINAFKA